MEEMLVIYDEDLKAIGIKSREEVHKLGLKHKVVQCYIIQKNNNEKYIYFQQRAYDKDTCPGMYDIACAGHIDAGEEILYSMKRELYEEVGINALDNDLKYVGRKLEYNKKGKIIDDEICELFILEVRDDNEISINEELLDIVKAPFNMYEKWINKEFDILNAISIKDNKEVKITEENSCHHIREYNKSLIEKIIEF